MCRLASPLPALSWINLQRFPLTASGLAFALILLLPLPTAAQGGRVEGRVLAAVSGDPLEGVRVSVVAKPIESHTAGDGFFGFPVPSGPLTVLAELPGYLSDARALIVPPGQTITVDFTMQVMDPERAPDVVFYPPTTGDTIPIADLSFAIPDSALLEVAQWEFESFEPRIGGALSLALLPNLAVEVRAERITPLEDGAFKWVGHVWNPLGFEEGNVVIVVREGRMTADIRYQGRIFHILPTQGRFHAVVEVDPSRIPSVPDQEGEIPRHPIEPPPPPDPDPPDLYEFRPLFPVLERVVPFEFQWIAGSVAPNTCSDFANMTVGTYPEIRLLVLYTDDVAAADEDPSQPGDILSEIDIMVEHTNQALKASDIPQRVTLAHAEEIDATDAGVGTQVQVNRLVDPDYVEYQGVLPLRNLHYADVTVLIVQNGLGGASFKMEAVTVGFESLAYAAVNRGSALSKYDFTHELGHIMGAQHNRPGAGIEMKPYHYNHGYDPDTHPWATVMANPDGSPPDPTTGLEPRLLRFSNPDLAYEGIPTGIASDQADAADNRRALRNTAAVVSSFRLTPVWFASASGTSAWFEKRVAPETMARVRFGDFDGDLEADAFKIDEGTGVWWWSRSGSEPWKQLNALNTAGAVPLEALGFGDFDGDGKTDVFRSDPIQGEWFISYGGSAAWVSVNGPDPAFAHPVSDLAFGNFDGDEKTDVFWSDHLAGTWFISSGAAEDWLALNPTSDPDRAYRVSELRFGDFDDDELTDVFIANPGLHSWYVSSGGSGPVGLLSSFKSEAVTELAFGDFDGDGVTDAFKANGISWQLSKGAKGPWEVLRTSCHKLASLRFADFDGDGTTDVIRKGIRP